VSADRMSDLYMEGQEREAESRDDAGLLTDDADDE